VFLLLSAASALAVHEQEKCDTTVLEDFSETGSCLIQGIRAKQHVTAQPKALPVDTDTDMAGKRGENEVPTPTNKPILLEEMHVISQRASYLVDQALLLQDGTISEHVSKIRELQRDLAALIESPSGGEPSKVKTVLLSMVEQTRQLATKAGLDEELHGSEEEENEVEDEEEHEKEEEDHEDEKEGNEQEEDEEDEDEEDGEDADDQDEDEDSLALVDKEEEDAEEDEEDEEDEEHEEHDEDEDEKEEAEQEEEEHEDEDEKDNVEDEQGDEKKK